VAQSKIIRGQKSGIDFGGPASRSQAGGSQMFPIPEKKKTNQGCDKQKGGAHLGGCITFFVQRGLILGTRERHK